MSADLLANNAAPINVYFMKNRIHHLAGKHVKLLFFRTLEYSTAVLLKKIRIKLQYEAWYFFTLINIS